MLPQKKHSYLRLEAFGMSEGTILKKDKTVIGQITPNNTILYFNYYNSI